MKEQLPANYCIAEILAKAAGRYEELQSLLRLCTELLNVNVSSCEEEKQNSAPDLKNLINWTYFSVGSLQIL